MQGLTKSVSEECAGLAWNKSLLQDCPCYPSAVLLLVLEGFCHACDVHPPRGGHVSYTKAVERHQTLRYPRKELVYHRQIGLLEKITSSLEGLDIVGRTGYRSISGISGSVLLLRDLETIDHAASEAFLFELGGIELELKVTTFLTYRAFSRLSLFCGDVQTLDQKKKPVRCDDVD